MSTDIKHVQLEPAAFLSDTDFQAMSDAQRGIYCTLIFYLYCNNGKAKYDPEFLARLCNCGDCGYVRQIVKMKFQVRRDWIYHKRVTKELKRSQAKRTQALNAINERWKKTNDSNTSVSNENYQLNRNNNRSKEKRREDNINNPPTPLVTNMSCAGRFTLEEVINASILAGCEDKAKAYFDHYNSQGWLKSNGLPITDLPSHLAVWKQNQFRFEKGKKEYSQQEQMSRIPDDA